METACVSLLLITSPSLVFSQGSFTSTLIHRRHLLTTRPMQNSRCEKGRPFLHYPVSSWIVNTVRDFLAK